MQNAYLPRHSIPASQRRWLPVIVRIRTPLLFVAGLAVVAGATPAVALVAAQVGPGSANASAARSFVSAAATPSPSTAAEQAVAALANAPAAKVLDYDFQLQPNYYFCGPAATRIALSAHDKELSQTVVAKLLGTTVNGTDSAVNVTKALNSQLGANHYQTREIRARAATPAQMDQLQADIVAAIGTGDVLVANVAGAVTDTLGGRHSYPGGHYLTVVGYSDQGRMATIADPADTVADGSYHLSTIDLANWIATRGYSY
jgi:Peptidase_C39 like family